MASQAKTPIQGQSGVLPAIPGRSGVLVDDLFKGITRDNGVAFKCSHSIPTQPYIDEFSKTNKVLFASRISNGRIAAYLGSRKEVTDAVERGFTFDNTFLDVEPLAQPTTRLTLSNVYPEIPNTLLINNLSSFCKVVSPIRPIPLGFKQKNLSHIMSFRRQVQVLVVFLRFERTQYRCTVKTLHLSNGKLCLIGSTQFRQLHSFTSYIFMFSKQLCFFRQASTRR